MPSSRPATVATSAARGGLGRRLLQPELMDSPSLPADQHRAALAGLARLNRLSGAPGAIWRQVRRALPGSGRLALLDVACGSGDVVAGVARRARRAGRSVQVTVADVAAEALRAAGERFDRQAIDAELVQVDLLREPLPGGRNVVTCSLFLHHLEDDDAVAALRAMAAAAGRLLVVDDLVRGSWGYALAATIPRLVTRSPVVHVDARRSVRAAFTVDELAGLARTAGLRGARVIPHWPARQLLVWERPASHAAGEVTTP